MSDYYLREVGWNTWRVRKRTRVTVMGGHWWRRKTLGTIVMGFEIALGVPVRVVR